jgi:uncharacterized protein
MTEASTPRTTEDRSGRRQRHTVPTTMRPDVFFAATFLLSGVVWVPLMLIRLGVLPPVIPLSALTAVALPGVLMPSVAASLLTFHHEGRPGVARLCARLRIWRVGRWWVAVLLVQPVVLVVTAAAYNALRGDDPVHVAPGLTAGSLLGVGVFLVVASTGEEVGWRGLALPALQARHSAVTSSLVLAFVTATWHVPYWILQGVLDDYTIWYLAIDYVFIVALTFQLTWLVNHAAGSVLVAVAFHFAFNLVNVAVLPVTASTGAFALLTAVECALAVALLGRLTPPEGASELASASEQ